MILSNSRHMYVSLFCKELQVEAVRDEEERKMTEEATSCINKGRIDDILDIVDWQGKKENWSRYFVLFENDLYF